MTGLRVLIAGGGLGIGQYITEFLVNKHGAKVVVLGLHVAESIAELETQGKIRVVRGDATRTQIHAETMKVVQEYLGGLDSLIITMGIIEEIERVARVDMDKLRRTYEINVFAPIQLTQQYLPLVQQSKGNIIITSSAVDRDVTWSAWGPYSSSKAALSRFIEILGREETEAKVYGIYPGLTRTAMVTDLVAGKFKGKMRDDEIEHFIEQDKTDAVEPPQWTANVMAKLAAGVIQGNWHGKCLWYNEMDPHFKDFEQ